MVQASSVKLLKLFTVSCVGSVDSEFISSPVGNESMRDKKPGWWHLIEMFEVKFEMKVSGK